MLAIDDSITALELISTVLSSRGHEVRTATSGKEGVTKYAEFRPDIVTLDLAMPGMDGYETLAALKRMDRYANVIMLTAANHSSALEHCLREGAIDFIAKPFTATDILNTMHRAINNPHYYNRDSAVFFSQLKDKLRYSLGRSSSTDWSIALKTVRTVSNVLTQEPNSNVQGFDYAAREEDSCFITRITGEKDGMVMSVVKNKDLAILFDINKTDKGMHADSVVEFFNMINMKVVSQLADSTRLKLDGCSTMFFSNPRRMSSLWSETARMWTRVEIGIFEISNSRDSIPLIIQMLWDGELFTR